MENKNSHSLFSLPMYCCPLVLAVLRGLHTTNLSLQTRVGKLKLVCVNGTKTVGKHVGKLLATNRTCLYSRQLFRQLFRVGKLEFDV